MRRLILGLLLFLSLLLVLLPAFLVWIRPRPLPPPPGYPLSVTLWRHDTGELLQLPLEEYVKGVVAAEMPAEFHPEALKAQAVLARTYVVRRLRQFGGPGAAEGRADVSSDPAQGQGWLDHRSLRRKWGLVGFYRYWRKISAAVEQTSGQALTFQGELAEALYHSTCGGRTESSQEVWGRAVPYLQSVACEFCRESPHFRTQTAIPLRQLAQQLGAGGEASPALSAGQKGWKVLQYSAGGRVKLISVGDLTLKGTDFRVRLGLPSTWFTWQMQGDRVVFDLRGWGHGVGMCQYGANGQARQGRSYQEILGYYFPGTAVRLIYSE